MRCFYWNVPLNRSIMTQNYPMCATKIQHNEKGLILMSLEIFTEVDTIYSSPLTILLYVRSKFPPSSVDIIRRWSSSLIQTRNVFCSLWNIPRPTGQKLKHNNEGINKIRPRCLLWNRIIQYWLIFSILIQTSWWHWWTCRRRGRTDGRCSTVVVPRQSGSTSGGKSRSVPSWPLIREQQLFSSLRWQSECFPWSDWIGIPQNYVKFRPLSGEHRRIFHPDPSAAENEWIISAD